MTMTFEPIHLQVDEIITAVVAGYLFGSLAMSVWWGRAFYKIDVREHGSLNAGATNTFRVLGRRAGFPVLILDVLKGFVPIFFLPRVMGYEFGQDEFIAVQIITSFAAVIGHLYPIFAQFKGGKGIATSLGAIFAIHPGAAGICIAVFLLLFLTTRYVSVGSLLAAVSFPLSLAYVFPNTPDLLVRFALALCLIVLYTHRKNIGRLLKGEENRMSIRSSSR
jgi:glycerol-3-phosphate acyltransferase PlsY